MDGSYRGKWDRDELEKLYYKDKLTLQEIGDKFGITRSRVQQVMRRLKIERRRQRGATHKNSLGRQTRYLTLNDYLKSTIRNSSRHNFASRTVKKYLPEIIPCSECKKLIQSHKAHIHHIVYPAVSIDDIQVLCPTCHALKHKGKMTYASQVSVYMEYSSGRPLEYLVSKYNVSYNTIINVIKKIETGCSSLREATMALPEKPMARRKWKHG